ncbi:hypothetical protein [Vreelandella zhaodongensis]|uniref:hypothetical protein n=1 Tax=Vreelandella zhaodongensis TaxID=1176240 RepID=UPI003EC0414B
MQTVGNIMQNKAAAAAGLKAAVRILDKWRATGEQGESILPRLIHECPDRAA